MRAGVFPCAADGSSYVYCPRNFSVLQPICLEIKSRSGTLLMKKVVGDDRHAGKSATMRNLLLIVIGLNALVFPAIVQLGTTASIILIIVGTGMLLGRPLFHRSRPDTGCLAQRTPGAHDIEAWNRSVQWAESRYLRSGVERQEASNADHYRSGHLCAGTGIGEPLRIATCLWQRLTAPPLRHLPGSYDRRASFSFWVFAIIERQQRDLAQSDGNVSNVKDYAIFMLDPKGHVLSWSRAPSG